MTNTVRSIMGFILTFLITLLVHFLWKDANYLLVIIVVPLVVIGLLSFIPRVEGD
ncbi:hypothetical protein vBBceHLY2_00068 [Bacillus phage vB_BceH_LY2]|nr:hypothetical protein vBBceHLY2_00068 [Bacillus phage vB_BceH_LY2]